MPSRSGASAAFMAWTAQRVEVYVALAAPAGGLALAPDRAGRSARLPGVVLAHGEHPRDAALRALVSVVVPPVRDRLRLHRVLSDVRPLPDHPGLHVLRLVFEPDRGLPLPVADTLLVDPEPVPVPVTDEVPGAPPRVQRPAAYAVVVQDGEVLLTRLTGSTLWTLPGGGIDHGEHPDDAVRRETFEETGLELQGARLLDVDSQHFTGRSPRAVVEDFHGVRLLYRGTVSRAVAPAVQEIGGTTEAAAWWPVVALGRLRLSPVVRTALALLA
jgi:ADP-ribose pyrophosphatase YjhB (NUDIX family)